MTGCMDVLVSEGKNTRLDGCAGEWMNRWVVGGVEEG